MPSINIIAIVSALTLTAKSSEKGGKYYYRLLKCYCRLSKCYCRLLMLMFVTSSYTLSSLRVFTMFIGSSRLTQFRFKHHSRNTPQTYCKCDNVSIIDHCLLHCPINAVKKICLETSSIRHPFYLFFVIKLHLYSSNK